MPIYDFRCSGCNKIIEKIVTYDDSETICSCEKKAVMNKVFTKPNIEIEFKGTGFYKTDYENI